MFEVFFRKANELNLKGRPFAMAVVVRREAPVSGRAGDKAIIEADGSIHGWIGGGCTQPVIISEAQKALRDGKSRLVRITPTTSASPTDGIIEYAMSCHSGGALDIYIEPVMPKPQLIIFGQSVVAQTLARLGKVLNYRVVAVAPGASAESFPEADAVESEIDLGRLQRTPQTYVVIATQGDHDLEALREAAKYDLPYVAFVASRKKAAEVFEEVKQTGVAPESLEDVKVPAGLNIQARTPEEIAVSILAEIIQVMRTADADQSREDTFSEVLEIEDMSCQHCVQTVETALRSVEGVTVHEVNVGSASISYDPTKVHRHQIIESVQSRGYAVK